MQAGRHTNQHFWSSLAPVQACTQVCRQVSRHTSKHSTMHASKEWQEALQARKHTSQHSHNDHACSSKQLSNSADKQTNWSASWLAGNQASTRADRQGCTHAGTPEIAQAASKLATMQAFRHSGKPSSEHTSTISSSPASKRASMHPDKQTKN